METLCTLAQPRTLAVIGLVLNLLGTLLIIGPLFCLRPKQVVRGDKALFWSREDDPEARLLRRQPYREEHTVAGRPGKGRPALTRGGRPANFPASAHGG